MRSLLISLATLLLLPVWMYFAYASLWVGASANRDKMSEWTPVLIAFLTPLIAGGIYYGLGWEFFWINSTVSALLLGFPAMVVGMAGGKGLIKTFVRK